MLLHKNMLIILVYYLDQKIPRIHSENSKYKFYSSKVILSPLKYSPSTATHLSPALDPALETFLELYCRYSHQSRLRFFHYFLSAVKTRSP